MTACVPISEPVPASFVSKNELEAIISREPIAKASTYIVRLKCEGGALKRDFIRFIDSDEV